MPKYWVGGTGNTSDATNHWATSSGGSPGSGNAPTAADDIIFDANSGTGTVTINATLTGRSIQTAGSSITTCVHNAATPVTLGDATAGTGNKALDLSGFASYSVANSLNSIISFVSTSATQQTVTTNGHAMGSITVSGAGSSYLLVGALTAPVANFVHTGGTFNTGNYTVSCQSFSSSGSTARSTIFGTSIVNLSGTGSFWTVSGSNVTISAASATIICTSASTTTRTFNGGGSTYGTLTYTVANSPGTLAITGTNTFGALNVGPGRTATSQAATVTTIGSFAPAGQNNGYLYLSGTGVATVADSAAISVSGNFTVAVRAALNDWTPSATQTLAAKWDTNSNRSLMLSVNTSGTLALAASSNGGGAQINVNSSVATSFTDGSIYWVAATYNSSTGEVKFWTASGASNAFPTGASWTQLGTTIAAGAMAIFDSTAPFTTGGINPPNGKFYRTVLASNALLDGTGAVCDMDFTTKAFGANTFVESSVNAATVTLTGFALVGDGRVALASAPVNQPTYIGPAPGSPPFDLDYVTLQDIRSYRSYGVFAGTHGVDVSGNLGVVFAARDPLAPYVVRHGAAGGTSLTTQTVTFIGGGTATAGNLLVAVFGGPVSGTATAGWTRALAANTSTAFLDVWWKISDGTETSVSWTNGVSNTRYGALYEVANFVGVPSVDVTDSNGSSSSGTSLSTAGTAPANTAPAFILAAFYTSGSTNGTTVSWSDGFFEEYAARLGRFATATLPVAATGARSTTYTYTTSTSPSQMILVGFKGSPLGNPASLLAFFP